MKKFNLVSTFQPAGDQPQAISRLTGNLSHGTREQVLLGVTGSGKTFTMAHTIATLQRPTLIISHNKTLAAQLFQEFRDFFPENAVSYFVSYYDYYQPEAYIPTTDTYIEKETEINEEIDKLRLAATTNLLTRPDTIVVASVSCIYNIGSPKEYGHFVLELKPGMKVSRESIFDRLVTLQYERGDFGFHRGTFRVRGDTIDLFPAYEDVSLRMVIEGDFLTKLQTLDPLTGKKVADLPGTVIYPAKHYMTDPRTYKEVFDLIRKDLDKQEKVFKDSGKLIEAHRIRQRVEYDLEMIQEMGFVNGIENYSRYFDGRNPGDPPYSLFDYFKEAAGNDWLLFVDESHMTIPQIRGMYNGDRARKQTLIDYGFRLPAAIDNRPMKFDEFLRRIPQTIYVSATPDEWEMSRATESAKDLPGLTAGGKNDLRTTGRDQKETSTSVQYNTIPTIVEQLVRPTGLLDPTITIRPVDGQIQDLMKEIDTRVQRKERVLVTTLTKRMAEDLSKFLEERGVKVQYVHADVLTLERSDILADLRMGKYDVVVGINLLREGLDLPEVSLVAILDADKEGFLRSRISLIQTMGRAARHSSGEVILYADTKTKSIAAAIEEVERRREIQITYNRRHGITPKTIQKPIRDRLVEREELEEEASARQLLDMNEDELNNMTPQDKDTMKKRLTAAMRTAARDLNFELAARIRDFLTTI